MRNGICTIQLSRDMCFQQCDILTSADSDEPEKPFLSFETPNVF